MLCDSVLEQRVSRDQAAVIDRSPRELRRCWSSLALLNRQLVPAAYARQKTRRLSGAAGVFSGRCTPNAKCFSASRPCRPQRGNRHGTPSADRARGRAALSHKQSRTILQALRAGADVVEIGLRSSNLVQATKRWRIVDRNLERIFNLTMNLLAYSRPRGAEGGECHPEISLIDECLELGWRRRRMKKRDGDFGLRGRRAADSAGPGWNASGCW